VAALGQTGSVGSGMSRASPFTQPSSSTRANARDGKLVSECELAICRQTTGGEDLLASPQLVGVRQAHLGIIYPGGRICPQPVDEPRLPFRGLVALWAAAVRVYGELK
jgi:hypothetical protein